MYKKHVVSLSEVEREQLLDFVNHGEGKARPVKRARILLKANQGPGGPAWSDTRIAEALETSPNTVRGIRQRYKERGLQGAIYRKKEETLRPRRIRKLDGEAEAKLLAIACGPAPEGRAKWSVRLLANELVALQLVDSISHDTVWRTLKKTKSSPT